MHILLAEWKYVHFVVMASCLHEMTIEKGIPLDFFILYRLLVVSFLQVDWIQQEWK